MKRVFTVACLPLLLWHAVDAGVAPRASLSGSFPQTVRVRLWSLHPPGELQLRADPGQAQLRRCAACKPTTLEVLVLRAAGSLIRVDNHQSPTSDVRISGAYQIKVAGGALRADFPVEVQASDGRLLVTALMPMEEYIAGVLAGEAANFTSEEALKAMAVAARTFAVHFGSRHALDGFDFCDTTHCQDLRIAGIDSHLRRIAESTAGEILWYDGEPAATYYAANCGGTSEDGRFILGNDEARAPFLRQHSDQYCVRSGAALWRSEVSKDNLQRALAAEGMVVSGALRSVSVLHRTSSGRVEFLQLRGSNSVTVSALNFRSAVGRNIGWDRLKSNWYDVSDDGGRVLFHGRGSGHGVGLCQVGAEVMGKEGHPYREILSFYYPGTKLGISPQGTPWQHLANEDVELLTTQPGHDRVLLSLGSRYVHESEESTGLIYRSVPRLKIYPTVPAFRNSTGEPGWVAGSTRGRTIQLQPSDVLRQAGILENTLRHEFLHLLVESYTRPGTPLWFREGLVLWLAEGEPPSSASHSFEDVAALEKALRAPATEQQLRTAYAEAQDRVTQLARRYGKATLLDWVQNGLPPELVANATAQPSASR
jgi:stage II sporulation protein D